MTKHIIAFGRAWVCTPQAYKEIQEILLSIYGSTPDVLEEKVK